MSSDLRVPRINAIATAVPDSECNASYLKWAVEQISDKREAALFQRMLQRSGIGNRFSVLSPADTELDAGSFYSGPSNPSTRARMVIYAHEAPKLALDAVRRLPDLGHVTHLIVASCTGFTAPGVDQIIARELALDPSVERLMIGFMGCYAGVTALRSAGHIVRSDPTARVLVISVELCSLHLQPSDRLEGLLAMAQFADGAAAAIVTATGPGLALGDGISLTLADTDELITWTIGDTGFTMELSGEVPGRLATVLADEQIASRLTQGTDPVTGAWAVHPGGRSILDAVERGLNLPVTALEASRGVLRDYGNMSSATVLFVLKRLMKDRPSSGIALAFGPGLAVEGLRLNWTPGDAE